MPHVEVQGMTEHAWGATIRLRENEPEQINVGGETFTADVYVPEGSKDHTPIKPPPDKEVTPGSTASFNADGTYVVQVGSDVGHRLTIVVDTDFGPLPDMISTV